MRELSIRDMQLVSGAFGPVGAVIGLFAFKGVADF